MKNYYDILELQKTASKDDIKAAYRRLSKIHHPDVNKGDKKSEEKFKEISEAYSTLSDPTKKQEYDLKLNGPSDFHFTFDQWSDIFAGDQSDFGKGRFNQRRSSGGFKNPSKPSTEFLNIYKTIELNIKDMVINDQTELTYTKFSVDSNFISKETEKTINLHLNLRKKYINIVEDNKQYIINVKLVGLGNENISQRQNPFTGAIEKTLLIGDLHLTIKIKIPDGIKISNGDIIQEIEIPLHKIIFKKEKIRITTIFEKTYDAEISAPKYLNNIQFGIKDQGFLKQDGTLGSYIIKFNVITPKFNDLTKEELSNLKTLFTKNL